MFTGVREKQFHWHLCPPCGGSGTECRRAVFSTLSAPPAGEVAQSAVGGYYELSNLAPVNYDYRNRPRRQDFEGLIAENGACYINSVGNIKRDKCRLTEKIAAYELPSYTAYEIDEEADWIIVETLMKKLM